MEEFKNVPAWIKKSEIWKNRKDYDFTGLKVYKADLKIRNLNDFKKVFKTIQFWQIASPYPSEIWNYIVFDNEGGNKNEVKEFLATTKGDTAGYFFKLLNWSSKNRDRLLELVAGHGETELLKLTIKNGFKMTAFAASFAASNNELECLTILHENNCPWDENTCESAATNLDCLMYLHENGCPWGSGTIYSAAESGNFECLTYAVDNGCDVDENCYFNCLVRKYVNLHVKKVQ